MDAAPPNNTVLRATRDYNPVTPAGLPVRVGCFYVLLRERGRQDPTRERRGLYFVYNVAGKYGYVPISDVAIGQGAPPDEEDRMKAVAVAAFHADGARQLSLEAGDILNVMDRSPTGWFFGELLMRNRRSRPRGWFPRDFIRDWFEFAPRGDALSFQFVVQARKSQLEVDGFLPFNVGEWMDVIQIPNTNDEEWIGRNSSGRIGKIRKERLRQERGDIPSVLLEQPWYHQCGRAVATELLQPLFQQPAHYIIRDSSEVGNFAITVTNGEATGPLNVRVEVSLAGYAVEGRNFKSLVEIVAHYGAYPIHRDDIDGRQIFLHHHVTRADWVDPQAAAGRDRVR